MEKNVEITRFKGKDILPFIPELADLRLKIFNSYPYLYEGDLDSEYSYLNAYIQCSESIIVLARANDKIIGVSSAIPLTFETIEFQQPFLDNNINVQDIFYFGESVLLPEYRGQGIYKHFFMEREKAAKEYGCPVVCFAAIERAVDDPRRPEHYVPLDNVWKRFGYEKHPHLCAYLKWKEIGETMETPKPLLFWLKTL